MAPKEQAYQEALRRIREAERTGALELDLSGCNETAQVYTELITLNWLPPELERLTSLQSLDFSFCHRDVIQRNLAGSELPGQSPQTVSRHFPVRKLRFPQHPPSFIILNIPWK